MEGEWEEMCRGRRKGEGGKRWEGRVNVEWEEER